VSLDNSALANKLQGATNLVETPADYWNKFAEVLNSYLTANTEIEGTYIGFMPNGKPSTNNGNYTWKIKCNLSGGSLLSAIQNSDNPNGTQNKLSNMLKVNLIQQSLNISSVIPVILDGDVKLGCSAIIFDFNSKPEKPGDTSLVFAKAILNGIKSAIPIPPTMSATSVDGSKGIVTFLKQS
jgi:hypothetical protein